MKNINAYLKKIKTLIDIDLILLFLKRIFQKARENNLFVTAMAMVYITTLSIVPFLIFSFYIMTLFNFFGNMEIIVEEIKNLILNNLAAGTGEELLNYLELYILNVDIEQLGIISFISLILIIVFMLARVEITFNKIWNVEEHRDLLKRFVSFWTFITLGTFSITLILTLTLLFTERYLGLWLSGSQLSQSNIFNHILFLFNFLIFIIVYYFVPNTKVELSSALFSGVFSGLLFILLKNIYGLYTSNIVTYNQLYGPLSVIPIFLLWLYLNWLIILLGAVISYVFQHRSTLKYMSNKKKFNSDFKNLLPIAVLITVYKNYSKAKPTSLNELLDKINLPAEEIEKTIKNLKKNSLLVETDDEAFLPLKKVNNLSIWEVYQSNVLKYDLKIEELFKENEMQQIYKKIKSCQKDEFEKLSFKEFLN